MDLCTACPLAYGYPVLMGRQCLNPKYFMASRLFTLYIRVNMILADFSMTILDFKVLQTPWESCLCNETRWVFKKDWQSLGVCRLCIKRYPGNKPVLENDPRSKNKFRVNPF